MRERGFAGLAVIGREATRTSRRWQTYLVRVGFAAVLVLAVLYTFNAQLDIIRQDSSQSARVGKSLFSMFLFSELLLVLPMAPILVGQAIIEERQDGTLDLLTLTQLTPGSILWSKVFSRLALAVMLILSGAPLVSMTVALGGVDVWEVINGISALVLLTAWLGAIGGFTALTARTAVASLLSAAGFTIVGLIIAPAGLHVLHLINAGPGATRVPADWLSPMWAFVSASPGGLLVWFVAFPALIGLAAAANPTFQMVTAGESEEEAFGNLSPEIWKLERLKRNSWLIFAVWGVASVGLLIFEARFTLRPPVQLGLRVLQASMLSYLVTIGWVFGFQWLQHRFAALLQRPSSEVEPLYLSAWGSAWRAFRKRVWSNPVAWRESLTLGGGASALGGRLAVAAVLVLALPALVLSNFSGAGWLGLGLLGMMTGVLLTGLATIGSISTAKDSGTLSLLLTTTMTRGAILRGKLSGTAAQAFPIFALGMALYALGALGPGSEPSFEAVHCAGYGLPMVNSVLPKVGLLALWMMVSWLAMAACTTLAGLLVARRGPARLAIMSTAIGWYALPVVAASTALGRDGAQLAKLWMPVLGEAWHHATCAPGPAWLPAIAIQVAIAVLALSASWFQLVRLSSR